MTFIHVVFFNLKTNLVEHSYTGDSQDYLLLQPVCQVSAIKVRGNLPIFRNISFHISIKEEDRDNPSCQTSYFIKPCLYSNIPTFNMDRYLGRKECRILGGVPGVSRLYLSSFFIKFLSEISFFTDKCYSNHAKFKISTRPDCVTCKHTKASAVCGDIVLDTYLHRKIGYHWFFCKIEKLGEYGFHEVYILT